MSDVAPEVDLKALIFNAPNMSSLPTVYTKLNEAVDSPTSSSQDIADIIMEDSGLAARLLKLANSAYFGFPSRIETISQAVTVIGMKELRDLVLATSVVGMFKDIPEKIVSPASFIEHSIATGVAARVIAAARRENNVERFFVAGLLHDIGRLLLFINYPDQCAGILAKVAKTAVSLIELEKQQFGFSHADVARTLLTYWQLPPRLVQIAAYYYRPSFCKDYKLDATYVHAGEIFAKALGYGSDGDPFMTRIDDRTWGLMELEPGSIHNLFKEIELQLRASLDFLSSNSDD